MRCCDAPDFAYTSVGEDEVRAQWYGPEKMRATDVRGVIFPTVYEYTETADLHVEWGRRVMHRWLDPDSGEQVALWHWEDRLVPVGGDS